MELSQQGQGALWVNKGGDLWGLSTTRRPPCPPPPPPGRPQQRPRASSEAAAGEERLETWLTVALLLPARVTVECAAARAAFEPAAVAAAAAEASASAAPAAASGLQGLVAMGKKSSVDDEFAALTGGKAKGKGGGGSGKGGGKVAANPAAGSADAVDTAASKPVTMQSLLSDALVAAGTPATAGAPDRSVSLGYFQRFALGGNAAAGLPQQRLRSAGVMQVRGVARRH